MLLVIVLAVVGIMSVFILGMNQNLADFMIKKPIQAAELPTPSPVKVITSDGSTATWPTFMSKSMGLTIKYPKEWEVIQQQADKIVFGFKNYPYITISTTNQALRQKNIIQENLILLIQGTTAKSFYGKDIAFESNSHLVTISTNPPLHLYALVTGADIDHVFQQMYSTLSFGQK